MSAEETVKRGKRPRFYICAAIIDNDLQVIPVEAESKSEAIDVFTKEFNKAPEKVLHGDGGGFYIVKGGCNISDFAKMIVTVTPADHVRRTAKAFEGEFSGWRIVGSCLKATVIDGMSYNDNELASIEFEAPLSDNVKKPKIDKFQVVRVKDICNIVDIT